MSNSAIRNIRNFNHDYIQDGHKILELSKRLLSIYLRSNNSDKARILKLIASNYALSGLTINTTYNKPFSFMVNMGKRLIMREVSDTIGKSILPENYRGLMLKILTVG